RLALGLGLPCPARVGRCPHWALGLGSPWLREKFLASRREKPFNEHAASCRECVWHGDSPIERGLPMDRAEIGLSSDQSKFIERCVKAFRQALGRGERPALDGYLDQTPNEFLKRELLKALLRADW